MAAPAPTPRSDRLRRAVMINPFSLFFGPIFGKDMRVMGRRVATYWVRALYTAGLLGLVAFVFSMTRITRYSGAATARQLQDLAPILAVVLVWFQFVMLILIAPTLTGAAICDEKRARTLASVMTTPMTSAQVIMNKLASGLAQVAILTLVSAPFLLGVRVFGGLEAEAVAAVMSVTCSAVLLVAALGIFFSVRAKRSSNASGSAVLVFLAFTMGPTVGFSIYLAAYNLPIPPPQWLFPLSAPITLGSVSAAVLSGTPIRMLRSEWLINTGVNTGCAALVLLLSTARLRAAMLADASAGLPERRKKRRRSRREQAAGPAAPSAATDTTLAEPEAGDAASESQDAPPAEVFRDRDTIVGDHPVAWRECRGAGSMSRGKRILLACAVLALLAWLNIKIPPGSDEQGHMMVLVIGGLLMMIQGAVGPTPAIAGEREAGTWQALLTTTLSGFEILSGKAIGAVKRLWFWGAVIALQLCIGVLAGGLRPIVLLHVPLALVAGAVFLAGTGVLFSLIFKKATTAAVLNIGTSLFLWVGAPILLLLAAELTGAATGRRPTSFLGWVASGLWCLNPLVIAGLATDGAFRHRAAYRSDVGMYEMPWGPTSAEIFSLLVIGLFLVGVAAGVGALVLASRGFNRLGGRSS